MKATRAVGGVRVGDGALVPADDVGSRARGFDLRFNVDPSSTRRQSTETALGSASPSPHVSNMMRPIFLVAPALFVVSAHAQLLPFSKPSPWRAAALDRQHQEIMNTNAPGIQLPPSSEGDQAKEPPPPDGDVILSDVIGSPREINIFAGFTRDVSSVSDRLDDSRQNTTVLAPLNSAIQALPRKPWEDPEDYSELGTEAYKGRAGEDRAAENLRRFTESHVLRASPWREGEEVQTMGGRTLRWERKQNGEVVIQPGAVEVERIVSRVANGEVWVLRDVLNYAQ